MSAQEMSPRGAVEVVPLSSVRRKIGDRMRLSKVTAAHTLMAIEVDYSAVDQARRAAREKARKLTYLPFIARALASVIERFPHLNAELNEQERALRVYKQLNLGIAVDLEFQGLIVPVIKKAAEQSLLQLAAAVDDLSTRARTRKLAVSDVADGTFTITNAGGYGTLFTGAIINQPQVAILSTDGVIPKPVALAKEDGSYEVVVRPVGVLALTWDHRAFDGAYSAAALRALKTELEGRDWVAELRNELAG